MITVAAGLLLTFQAVRAQSDDPARDWHSAQQLALLGLAPLHMAAFELPAPEAIAWPLQGRISSRFGWRNVSVGGNRNHTGLDLVAASGTPVGSALSGTVSFAGWSGAYGYAVYVDHEDGLQSRYAHLSRISVSVGETIRQLEEVGRVGSTGASTGPHLHFELRVNGVAVDPLPRLPDGQSAQTGGGNAR